MAEQAVDTRHHDEIDDGGRNEFASGVIVAIILFILSPLTVLSAVATYLAFAWQKIKLSVIFWLGLVPYLVVIAIFYNFVISQFMKSWTVTVPAMTSQKIGIFDGLLQIFAQQALLAIPLGIVAGLVYSAYRWRTRPVWLETTFRLSPLEYFIKRKNIKDIKADRNSPRDGMTLGIGDRGKKIVQTYNESRAHTLILGAAGSGKTTTLLSRLRDSIKAGQGVVLIDLKGGVDVPLAVSELAKRYDRKFTHWLLQPKGIPYTGPAEDGPAYYDPLARGEATRRKDLLIESRRWSEEYYKQEASSYLQMLFSVLVANPKEGVSTLSDVVELLNPLALQSRAIPLGVNPEYADIIRSIDSLNDEKLSAGKKSAIDGLKSQLEVLLHSIAGPYLQVDPKGNNNINLKQAAHEGQIIVFSLDASNYGELAALVANLIIQDLKTVSSELRQDPANKPFQVVIDEFSAIGSENVIGLANKSRDADMPVTLTTQALGDLRAVNPAFLDQLLGIVNSFIIHRTNKQDDAEVCSGLTGTVIRKRFNESVVYSTGFITRGGARGVGSVEDIEEYAVKPNEIQHLRMGEMIYVNKSPMRVERVLCIPEDAQLVVKQENKRLEKTVSLTKTERVTNVSLTKEPELASNGFVTPPVNSGRTLPVMQPIGKPFEPVPTSYAEETVHPSQPANKDRLRAILNQDPDTLLPPNNKKDEFTVTHMPPRVSSPLPPAQKPVVAMKKLPPLPALPPKNVASPMPPLPPKPTQTKKDEFDF